MSIVFSSATPRSPAVTLAHAMLPLAAAIAFCWSSAGRAATITVNDPTPDSVAGMCTIVDAVTAVNTQTAVNGCAAGDGNNDTIDLSGFVVPTAITFTVPTSGHSHALALDHPVSIKGSLDSSGTPLVTLERSSVSGTGNFGLIETIAPLILYGLSLRNGSTPPGYLGGAILAGDALTVNNSSIADNASDGGGGIAGTDNVTLNHSTVSGNTAANSGGGMFSNSSIYIYYSTISGNTTTVAASGGGGGIYATSAILVRNSTISGNQSASKGGGIYAGNIVTLINTTADDNAALGGAGGGVFAMNAGVDASQSTLSNNAASTAGGGIYALDASLTNSTLTGNTAVGSGGGVNAQTLSMAYCTVFANTTQGIGGGVDFATSGQSNGSIIYGNSPDDLNTPSHADLSGSYNIIANSGWGLPADTINCDPMLGTLGNYGGPTLTLPLTSGSCALDAASSAPSATTDQRGYGRPAPGESKFKADIGAFERQASEDPDLVFADSFDE